MTTPIDHQRAREMAEMILAEKYSIFGLHTLCRAYLALLNDLTRFEEKLEAANLNFEKCKNILEGHEKERSALAAEVGRLREGLIAARTYIVRNTGGAGNLPGNNWANWGEMTEFIDKALSPPAETKGKV